MGTQWQFELVKSYTISNDSGVYFMFVSHDFQISMFDVRRCCVYGPTFIEKVSDGLFVLNYDSISSSVFIGSTVVIFVAVVVAAAAAAVAVVDDKMKRISSAHKHTHSVYVFGRAKESV